MKIFNSIQWSNSDCVKICRNCKYFKNDPNFIEQTYNGLTTLSSGFASVRHQDGLCNYNQLYLSAFDSCTHFEICSINVD